MVAIRHTASSEQQRTTMILLCEDGSLRIYMANVDNTSYWLQPSLQPSCGASIMKPVRKRKTTAAGESLLGDRLPVFYQMENVLRVLCCECDLRPHTMSAK